ncbi:hypothetical protein I302_109056 [Kwoniella bestiolae CBS 10118]|uniref:Coenzyme Q-binding protein COQ10 START domain-containing protein n=1 Tax=Kwoniella bestiolae CBS 10118 TaxID=1296100 RepID=A0A1B9FUV1_9TREE|nr:hypothetical protein I302_08200 [Kwoniella bestiolae CBS 10118]OCF22550.1 hypothetical protein I302_08200 [Kwoniella bestiolae CBS 10118]
MSISSTSTIRPLVRSLTRSHRSIPSPSSSTSPLRAALTSSNPSKCIQQQQIQRRAFFSLPDITKLAGLVPTQSSSSIPNTEGIVSGIETDGEEQRFHARKILPYSQAQLYSLVSDVPSYSSFIPFCNSSTVLSKPHSKSSSSSSNDSDGSIQKRQWKDWAPGSEPFEVLAELAVGFGGLEERYVSRVKGVPFESVTATASSQTPLFKSLITRWSFSPASHLSPHPSNSPFPPSSPSHIRMPNTNSTTPQSDDPNTGPTLLTIDLNFNFANPLHRIASQAVLPKVADKMVEAFEKRCLEVYGKGDQ